MHPQPVIPDEGRRALLRRAAELEGAGRHALADVRAAAAEAGVAPEFVDAALAELAARGALEIAPRARWRRWGGAALATAGSGFLIFWQVVQGSPADFVLTALCLGTAGLGLYLRRRR